MRKTYCLLLALALTVLSGCHFYKETPTTGNDTHLIVDDENRQVRIKKHPERIVSLTYGTDEILLDLVDIERIKGLSKYAGDTDLTFITKEQKNKVGVTVDRNLEQIMKLNPDLVIASTSVSKDIVDSLTRMGVPVYVSIVPTTLAEVETKVTGVAKAVNETGKGEAIIKQMREENERIEKKLSVIQPNEEKVVLSLSFRGIIGKKGTLFNEILRRAHVKNGADFASLPAGSSMYISAEIIPQINPDVFLMPVWKWKESDDEEEFLKELKNNPAYKGVSAVKNNKFIRLQEKYKYVMSHHVTEAIEETAKAVYPELWQDKN